LRTRPHGAGARGGWRGVETWGGKTPALTTARGWFTKGGGVPRGGTNLYTKPQVTGGEGRSLKGELRKKPTGKLESMKKEFGVGRNGHGRPVRQRT